jgi:Cu/Ag efflux pump CusA
LTVEFRSYIQPVIILAIIPFGIVGAIVGHAIMGLPLTLFTMFGLVALTGVVVNDSIVLIDFINHRVREGAELIEAVLSAGERRFRPVLLTSVTTIAGLTPMLTETSFQAQFLIPLAATLVFGLSFATALVLVLVPTFYVLYRSVAGMPDHDDELGEAATTVSRVEPSRPSDGKTNGHSSGNGNNGNGSRSAGNVAARGPDYQPASSSGGQS